MTTIQAKQIHGAGKFALKVSTWSEAVEWAHKKRQYDAAFIECTDGYLVLWTPRTLIHA